MTATPLAFRRWTLLLATLWVSGCATPIEHRDLATFALIGDAPYSEAEEFQFAGMIDELNREPLSFVIHVGDIKAGSNSPCTDALFAQRKAMLDASRHALVLTPGDNDWMDCARDTNGSMDPYERLEAMRRLFFGDSYSLGRTPVKLERQNGFRENQRFRMNDVVVATLNMPGPNNMLEVADDARYRARDEANIAWLREAFEKAQSARVLVIATQANPGLNSPNSNFQPSGFKRVMTEFAQLAKAFGKPVLLLHGDTHVYRKDQPIRDAGGQVLKNVTRVESFGSPVVAWVKIVVTDDPAKPFSIQPVKSRPAGN